MSRQRTLEKIAESEYVSIGELVRLTGYRYSTLKFYTEEGLLDFEQEGERLTRRFHRESAVKQIEKIRGLRESGKSIPEIKSMIKRT